MRWRAWSYLEALREQRPNRADILDIARSSLEALGYWPLPEASVADEAVVDDNPFDEDDSATAGFHLDQFARGIEVWEPPAAEAEQTPVAVAGTVDAAGRPLGAGHDSILWHSIHRALRWSAIVPDRPFTVGAVRSSQAWH